MLHMAHACRGTLKHQTTNKTARFLHLTAHFLCIKLQRVKAAGKDPPRLKAPAEATSEVLQILVSRRNLPAVHVKPAAGTVFAHLGPLALRKRIHPALCSQSRCRDRPFWSNPNRASVEELSGGVSLADPAKHASG